jgi:hypothetical protein
LKVTVVRVGVAVHAPPVLVVVVDEGEEVREGQAVLVAVLQGPVAEPLEQVDGRRAWRGMGVLVGVGS